MICPYYAGSKGENIFPLCLINTCMDFPKEKGPAALTVRPFSLWFAEGYLQIRFLRRLIAMNSSKNARFTRTILALTGASN